MQQLSFKNRIASNYIITTALLIFVVFCVIYSVVRLTFYNDIDGDIALEVTTHLNEIKINKNDFHLVHEDEWKEREHNTVDVNPVFIAFYDKEGSVLEKSPNLKNEVLHFDPSAADNELYDTKLLKNKIRQIQVPIFSNNVSIGHIIIAMSLEGPTLVLNRLAQVLIITYPLILVLLFFIARFIAGRSIKPINAIINTSNNITRDNLTARIPLPQNKDELYTLSKTINNLLDRIENAIDREKQFTSDASHELRTPLTVLKGTLEVLVRKPRNTEEYLDKITFCITEIDRLNQLVDQLLLLARFENQKKSLSIENLYLNGTLLDVISRFSSTIENKNIQLRANFNEDYYVQTDNYLFSIIISNLLSNAIKYSAQDGVIVINIQRRNNKIECSIVDSGIGIAADDLEKVFNPFFRSDANEHPQIKGTGLGLSIVKKLCLLLAIEIQFTSKVNNGTSVNLSLDEAKLK